MVGTGGRLALTRFVDTNVLVRYLTGEPPDVADAARRILDGSNDLVLTDVALAECGYVLISVYGISREEVVDGLIGLIAKENITVFGLDDGLGYSVVCVCAGPPAESRLLTR